MSFVHRMKRSPPAPPDTVAGYIFTRAADLYGRCIALVGRGDAPHDDGSSVFVDVDVLRTTANHHLITQGVVYPTYYRALRSCACW
jgi:hypothetical protein